MKCLKCGCENPDDARLCKSCGLELSGQDATEQISSGADRSYGDSDDLTFDDFIINKRFMIIKRLGKGGMGTIFHARDVKLKREVAIKCISEKTLEDFQSKARFLREAQTASQLEHPNICTIYETYEEEKNNYIVMQYVDGVTLDHIIKLKKLSINKILDIGIQICQGMIEAHSKEIIHRDIKPANIMVDHKGIVKILDFGLAKFRDESIMKKKDMIDSANLTEKGILMGTATYMSPEQARGEKLDSRSDIFSFGVVLYEMIEGVNPFQDEDNISTLYKVINKQVDFIRDVPEELKNIVKKALEKKVSDRAIDLKSIKEDLEKIRKTVNQSKEQQADNSRTEIINTRDRHQLIREMQKTSDQEGLGDIVDRIKKIKARTEPLGYTRSHMVKILAIPVVMALIVLSIIIFTRKKGGNILIPDSSKIFYIYLHDVENKTGDNEFSEKLNYLLYQSLNQFNEFKTINEEIASSIDAGPADTASAKGIPLSLGERKEAIPALKQKESEDRNPGGDTLDILSKQFNLLFEVKVECTRFNDFYNIDAVLMPVIRGKKSFHITVPIQNKDALIQNQVDTFTERLVQSIFQNKSRDDFRVMKISKMFGAKWHTFSDFFEGLKNYKKLKFSEAEYCFKKSIDLLISKYFLADIYYFNGKREEAIRLINDIIPRLDDVTESFRFRILALKSRLDFNFEEEIRNLEHLKDKFPFLIDAFFELGEAHFHRGNATEAIPYYKQAIEINRNYSKAINHLGYCYSYLGDHNRAIQLFEDYRNLDQSANSFDSLGDGYFYAGDWINAETLKLAAVSKNRKSVPWSFLTLADIYILKAEYEKVKPVLDAYIGLVNSKKENARALAKKAYTCILDRQYINALSLLNRSIATFNSDDINDYTVAEAHWLKGIVLLSLDKLKESRQELEWLDRIKQKYNLSQTNFYIPYKYLIHLQALISEKQGKTDEAESGFRTLLKLKTRLSYWVTCYHYQFFHTEYIRFLSRSDRVRDALTEIEHCLEYNPNYAPCLWEKAKMLEILGKPGEAQAVYHKIAEIYGDSSEKNFTRNMLKKKISS